MAPAALGLALGAATLHAIWNLLLRSRVTSRRRRRSQSLRSCWFSRHWRRRRGTSTPQRGSTSSRPGCSSSPTSRCSRRRTAATSCRSSTRSRGGWRRSRRSSSRWRSSTRPLRSGDRRRLRRRGGSAARARRTRRARRAARCRDRLRDRQLHARRPLRDPPRGRVLVRAADHAGLRGRVSAVRRPGGGCAPRSRRGRCSSESSPPRPTCSCCSRCRRASAPSVSAVRETSVVIAAVLAAALPSRACRSGTPGGSRAGSRRHRPACALTLAERPWEGSDPSHARKAKCAHACRGVRSSAVHAGPVGHGRGLTPVMAGETRD